MLYLVPVLGARLPDCRCLMGMEHEARLGYLCYQAATNKLTLDEMSELLGYIALDPHILDLIHIEIYLQKMYRK